MWPVDLLTVSPLFAAAARIPVGALPTDIYLIALSALILSAHFLLLSTLFDIFLTAFKIFSVTHK